MDDREETLVAGESQGSAETKGGADSFGSEATLEVAGSTYEIYRLDAVEGSGDRSCRTP